MANQGDLLSKTLAFGIILLLISISAQPSLATVRKEDVFESNHGQDDARWFASLKVDFGEEINNEKIDYLWWKYFLPIGDYYVHVKINFRCPPDKRIDVTYHMKVVCLGECIPKIFCDFEDSFTIINGSNPPDIDEKFVKYLPLVGPGDYWVIYTIEADLDVYEFVDGEWVLINEDSIYKEINDNKDTYERPPEFPFYGFLNMLFYEFLNVLLLPIFVLLHF